LYADTEQQALEIGMYFLLLVPNTLIQSIDAESIDNHGTRISKEECAFLVSQELVAAKPLHAPQREERLREKERRY